MVLVYFDSNLLWDFHEFSVLSYYTIVYVVSFMLSAVFLINPLEI